MAIAPREVTSLQNAVAPRLPVSPIEYDVRFMDEFIRILRLYFNQLDGVNTGLLGQVGGAYLHFPYGSFGSSVDQLITAAGTPQLVTFNTSNYTNATSLVSSTEMKVAQSGLYMYNYSLQLVNTDATSPHKVQIWTRKNGIDFPNTGSKVDVPAHYGTVDGYLDATGAFFIPLQAGDYVELVVVSNSTLVYMEAYTAQTTPYVRPAVPSASVTLTFISSVQG
jgi:hypothetical protein